MRKLLSIVLSMLTVLSLASATFIPVRAKADFSIEIPYGKPTVDGVISEGEYEVSRVMNKDSAAAWVGEVGNSSVTWYLAWDENGLYYAGTINDTTPSYREDNSHWVGIDCLELSVNPGQLIKGSEAEGIFFSFGSKANGGVVAYRHNFADGSVSDLITGKASGHEKGADSYTMEVHIPWSLVQLDEYCTVDKISDIHIDSTDFAPQNGAVLGLLPCAIDANEEEEILAAYKFNGTDFLVKDFIEATLVGGPRAEATIATTEPAMTTAPEGDLSETATTSATFETTEPDATQSVTTVAPDTALSTIASTDANKAETVIGIVEPTADTTTVGTASIPADGTMDTDAETTSVTSKGCASTVGMVSASTVALLASTVLLRRRMHKK